MQFWCFLLACSSCHNFVSYSGAKGTQTKGNRAVSLVQDSLGTDRCIHDISTLDFANSTRASFQGSFVSEPCASGSSLSQDDEFATKLVRRKGDEPGLEVLSLQANEQKACRVLSVLWNSLGAGHRQLASGWCRRRYSSSKKRMELANLGRLGRDPKDAEIILQGAKCICKEAEQRQRKREGSIQGQNGTVFGISFHCDADSSRYSPCHTIPATEHSPINNAGGQQFQHRVDDGHQKSVSRLSVDAFRTEGRDGEIGISGNEDAHPRTPSSNDFNGESAEGLQGASRCQRASSNAVASTYGDLPESMEAANGGVTTSPKSSIWSTPNLNKDFWKRLRLSSSSMILGRIETYRSSLSCWSVSNQVLMTSTGWRSTALKGSHEKAFQLHQQSAQLKAVRKVSKFGSRTSHYNCTKYALYKRGALSHSVTPCRSTQLRIGFYSSFQGLWTTKGVQARQQLLRSCKPLRGLFSNWSNLENQAGSISDTLPGFGFMIHTSWSKHSWK